MLSSLPYLFRAFKIHTCLAYVVHVTFWILNLTLVLYCIYIACIYKSKWPIDHGHHAKTKLGESKKKVQTMMIWYTSPTHRNRMIYGGGWVSVTQCYKFKRLLTHMISHLALLFHHILLSLFFVDQPANHCLEQENGKTQVGKGSCSWRLAWGYTIIMQNYLTNHVD